jgi:hypothetical protein
VERDVIERLTQVVTGDATMRTLTGWSTTDPRWYFYHRANAVVDPTHPTYMTYLLTGAAESTTGVRPPVVSVIIWGKTRTTVLATRDRLRALFDKRTLVTATGRKVRTRIVNEQDTYSEEVDFVGRQIQLRAAYLDP